ncbi:Putative aliphatic sulfonates transport permease protein SsuC [Mycolicibacterium vanbaalenii]|uniref:Aliphatic sulfonates transport permease protein SsuC n=1 Tax=Mycolicibacterium vanbaalenii TaxID=110539 RepID=A0A5S9R5X2_MYCVN|nr:ABC transporter permease [Mycolicibacterium vanbaalenii]CAA0129442.1 Putative aliphatic sulfonates transport permease protein SsuC [Mycolicibacterium vanbaalenii]
MTATTAERAEGGAPPAAGDAPPGAISRNLRRTGLALTGYVALFAVWSACSLFFFTPYVLPAPWTVGAEMWHLAADGTAFVQFGSSIVKIAVGFAIGTVVGVPLGLLMGRMRYWNYFFQQPLLVLGNVPGLAFAVFALILFGIGAIGPIVVVAFVALPYVALNVAQGVEEVDRNLIDMSAVYGLNRGAILRSVFLPSIMPFLFAALRYGFAMAWKVEALTEVFGGRSGIGFMIRQSYQEFSVAGVLAWTGFFVLFILLIERVFLAGLERRFFAWRGGR